MTLDTRHLISIIREQTAPFSPIPTDQAPSEHPLGGIRHISFDVYGTLIASGVGDIGNSAPADRGAALGAVLNEFSPMALPESRVLEESFLDEIRRSQEESRVLGAVQPEVEIRSVWRNFLRGMGIESISDAELEEIALRFELLVNPVWPMPGLVEVLDNLSTSFKPFSIVSNAQFFTPLLFPALVDRSLPELGFDESLCIWSYEQREAKPSPHLFQELVARLGPDFQPSEVLYVGNDKLNDVRAAQEAGLRTALFAGDQRSLRLREDVAECRRIKPDLVLTSLTDLPNCVQKTR